MKATKSLFILLAGLAFTIPAHAEDSVVFYKGTVEGAREKARKESKYYFIEFYAKWCEPCKWMDEYTYKNEELSDYVSQHYVPVKVDVENLDGYVWKQKFKVQYLPTIIVLNSNGTMLGKYEKSLTAPDLIRILKNHRSLPGEAGPAQLSNETDGVVAVPVKTNQENAAYPAFIDVNREPGLPKANEVNNPVKKPAAKPATNPPATNPARAASNPAASARRPVSGPASKAGAGEEYRIQVGVYSDATNVFNQVNQLKKTFSQVVQVFNSKNKETNSISYRITLGKFSSREEAAQFAQTLKAKGITGVIKHIRELEQK
jgi:thiol-disulfide isomerase/thioredoxin